MQICYKLKKIGSKNAVCLSKLHNHHICFSVVYVPHKSHLLSPRYSITV